MGTIEDYRSGRIRTSIGKALHVLGASALADAPDASIVALKICEFEPVVVSFAEAVAAIGNASTLAIGERVCRPLHHGSVFTESVFLDELAEAMIEAGHARKAGIEEAEGLLGEQTGNPLLMSKVSGRYLEICASSVDTCVFWKAEKQGIHCMKRGRA
ncbi:MAG: hypothetical protein HGB04_00675 [Chlorobiaceae bacterium]|nr:hypothetical protein [Chlorobiaceae bacterium]